MDTVGVERAHLVGTSYGAEVAMLFAVTHPRRTASLVSIDGVSELDPLLKAAVEGWKAAALADPVAFYRTTIPWNYSSAYLAANADALARRESAIAALPRGWFTSFAGLCDAFLRIDLTKDLGRITCPTLVMVAEHDILKGERFARIIADNVRGARLTVIAGAGHAVVVERPGEVAAAIAEFLDGCRRTEEMDGTIVEIGDLAISFVERGEGVPRALRARQHRILALVRARHGRARGADGGPGHAELRQVEAASGRTRHRPLRGRGRGVHPRPRARPARARRPLARGRGRDVARGAVPGRCIRALVLVDSAAPGGSRDPEGPPPADRDDADEPRRAAAGPARGGADARRTTRSSRRSSTTRR